MDVVTKINGYQAGVSDAIYDYQNGGVYNPVGSCLPCHSQDYWNDFHQGYDHQWGSYQSQDSTQGTWVNVINSPGAYVSTNQESNQQQNPLQQLAHVACGLLNCQQGPGYQGGYGPGE